MEFNRFDGAMFVYNFGAVLSGGLLALSFGIQDRVSLLVIAFGAAIIWTLYFKWSLLPRAAELAPTDNE